MVPSFRASDPDIKNAKKQPNRPQKLEKSRDFPKKSVPLPNFILFKSKNSVYLNHLTRRFGGGPAVHLVLGVM